MQKELNRACENNFPEFVKCAKDYKKLPGSAFKHKRCDRQKLNRSVELIKKVAESLIFLFCKQITHRTSRAVPPRWTWMGCSPTL